jgi:hypothetical protein
MSLHRAVNACPPFELLIFSSSAASNVNTCCHYELAYIDMLQLNMNESLVGDQCKRAHAEIMTALFGILCCCQSAQL